MALQSAPVQEQDIITYALNNFGGGLRYDLPSEKIPDNCVQDSLNTIFDAGQISKRFGYLSPIYTVADHSKVRWIDEWLDGNQVRWLIIVTDTKMLSYNIATNTFTDITPVGGLTGNLGKAVHGAAFSGKIVGVLTFLYFITNGVNRPFYWDGTAANAVFLNVTGSPVSAVTVAAFESHLMWFNVQDSILGNQPQEIIWSDFNDGLNYSSGDAAIVTLEDTNDAIISVEQIYSFLSVGRDRSIYTSQFIGFPFFYRFDRKVEKDGIFATNAFVRNNTTIIGLTKTGVISFDSSSESPYIGQPIIQDLIAGIIDVSSSDLVGSTFAKFDQGENKHRTFISHRADGVPDTEYAYSVLYQNWSKHQYANLITAIGQFQGQYPYTWNLLPNPWNSYSILWSSIYKSGLIPIIVYGDNLGNIYFQFPTYSDAGTPITAFFKTKAFETQRHPDWIKELQRIQFILAKQLTGTLIIHVFKSDDGKNFIEANNSPYTLDMSQSISPYVDISADGQWFYFHVIDANANEGYVIDEIRCGYVPLYRKMVA